MFFFWERLEKNTAFICVKSNKDRIVHISRVGTPIRFEFSFSFQAKKVAERGDCCCNSKTQAANHRVKDKMKYSSEESINHHVITEVPKAEEESFDDDVDEESRCVHNCKKWHPFNLWKPQQRPYSKVVSLIYSRLARNRAPIWKLSRWISSTGDIP